ncbi:MAG TPA: ABC transporter substrate-binding protein [Dehalococcoidia bacterium]|nr:ABC transporter substrate-binding protein [Dehalococcoidia bacterium]
MRFPFPLTNWVWGMVALVAIVAVACGQAAAPAEPLPTAAIQVTATPIPDATPTTAPMATPLPAGIKSARDRITLVMPEEPIQLNSLNTLGASVIESVTKANLQDPLTWQSGDDLRIVPTSATTGWEQLDTDTWRFSLRQGVKFHNGEAFNAPAALPSLISGGNPASTNNSVNYTSPFTAEVVDDYTVDINCESACPIFPSTAFFVDFEAPQWYAAASEEDRTRQSIGIGPYKQVDWTPGVSITQEAYEDYVPVRDHFEFQKARIQNATWVWRAEPLVIGAMIESGEADIGWDVSVDAIGTLPGDMLRAGTSAETYAMTMNGIWHPELKKKQVRQAIMHAVNCQELADSLYGGYTTCRGNIIWPGITGATEANTAPYEYDPDLSRQLLKEAGYNPENKITINTRAARVAKQIEISEAIVGYLSQVGMNAEFQVVESSVRSAMTQCGIGKTVQRILEDSGRDPSAAVPTNADFQAALDSDGPQCTFINLIGNQPSNETLDFGRGVNYYMDCASIRSGFCDLRPGGAQEKIGPALAASGEERRRLLEELGDIFHEEVVMLTLFDLPVFYAVDPSLNWEPRLNPVVRVNAMWFSE